MVKKLKPIDVFAEKGTMTNDERRSSSYMFRISHTGQLTTMTGNSLRCRHPVLVTRHLKLTALKRALEEELADDECLLR